MVTDNEHINIRKLRESLGLSQSAMADELGIGRTTYVNFETGKTRLYCKTLCKFAAYMGKSEKEVLQGGGPGGVLSEENGWKEQRSRLIEDYEQRLRGLRDKYEAAERVIQSNEITIKTLTDTNRFLLKQLGKGE